MSVSRETIFHFLRANGLNREADLIASCGLNTIFFVNDNTGEVSPHQKLCRSRWCPVCGKVWRNKMQETICDIIKNNTDNPLRFVTLTQIAQHDESLVDAYERFCASWTKLRRSDWWKANTDGAILKFEMNWNAERRWWHVHAHLLVKTRWLSRKALKTRWEAITDGAWHVDVRPIDNNVNVELCKYFSTLHSNPSVPLRELVEFCHGKQLIRYYGCFRGIHKSPFAEPERIGWRRFGDIKDLMRAVDHGLIDSAVIAISQYILAHEPDLVADYAYGIQLLRDIVCDAQRPATLIV